MRSKGAAEKGTPIRGAVVRPAAAVGDVAGAKAVAAVRLANAVCDRAVVEGTEKVGANGGAAVAGVA